jgi:SAM-dependent methyltransferase
VLDFGCGTGGFLVAARRAGYDCRGVEHDSDVAAKASAHTGIPVDTLDEVLAGGHRFDVVVLRDVLPHLPDPVATLRALEQLLDEGGAFFLDGPLEEGRSLVRLAAGSVKAVRRRTGLDRVGVTPPTMLFRVDAAAQRRFLVDRMGYTERAFEVYETGWPYHVPGRRMASPGVAVKEVTGLLAVAAARVGRYAGLDLGNRFFGLFEPGP